jgi:DNA-directed RNA polymerase subunit RPC12/RpoP
MPSAVDPSDTFDLVCPHCRKSFESRLIGGDAERYRGFKCPHCRLFVPAHRVADGNSPSS